MGSKVTRRDDGTDAWLIEGEEVSTFGLNASAGRVPQEWGTGGNTYGIFTNPWRWSENSFGDQLPSEVFRGRVLTCFIEDNVGLRLRDVIGVDNIAWECDYPHPDTTWPRSPESVLAQFEKAGCTDEGNPRHHVEECLPLLRLLALRAH